MSQCVVVECRNDNTDTVTKKSPWSVWSYRVCRPHADEVRAGATISDNPDGRTIVLVSASTTAPDPELPADPELRSGSIGTDPASETGPDSSDFKVVQS